MDELNFLQTLIEKGANLSNIAELFILYQLLSNFISRNKQVDDIEKQVGGEMEGLSKDVQTIKYEIEQTNRFLAGIYGTMERGDTSRNK